MCLLLCLCAYAWISVTARIRVYVCMCTLTCVSVVSLLFWRHFLLLPLVERPGQREWGEKERLRERAQAGTETSATYTHTSETQWNCSLCFMEAEAEVLDIYILCAWYLIQTLVEYYKVWGTFLWCRTLFCMGWDNRLNASDLLFTPCKQMWPWKNTPSHNWSFKYIFWHNDFLFCRCQSGHK